MELYREESIVTGERKMYMYGAFILIVASFGYEAYHTIVLGRLSVSGWGYSVLFLGMWMWRCLFKYTYILTEKQLIIISHGLGIKRTYAVDLELTESFTNKYVKSFFKKTKISHYIHRYSSVDPTPQRLLVFREGSKLAGVLFKGSDRFIRELRKIVPDKYLDFNN